MKRSVRDKVVVVTGASSGIGREAALAFARAGARVVVAARRPEPLAEVRREVEQTGAMCLAVTTDVTDRTLVQRLLDATLEHFGAVDVWVNNAGYGMVASVEHTSVADVRAIMETNYFGALHGCQVVLQQMRRQGSGHIINVSSLAGRHALPLNSAYAASKHAMNALGQALRAELAGTGITVTTVMPTLTDTGFFSAMVNKVDRPNGHMVRAMSAERVGRVILECAVRPRAEVALIPAWRLVLALADLFPGIYDAVARRYLRVRTGGRGTPEPPAS